MLKPVVALLSIAAWSPTVFAQSLQHPISSIFDSSDAPSMSRLPGLGSGFRQQILIGGARLQALQGKAITGFRIRRDLFHRDAMGGGSVDAIIHVSHARVAPDKAVGQFAANASTTPSEVFRGAFTVPTSPRITTPIDPWSKDHSIEVKFSTPFSYATGDLCLDIHATPGASGPDLWFVDFERGQYTGSVRSIGTSCSAEATRSGESLWTQQFWLQIGSTMRLKSTGQRGAGALLLLGASEIRGGMDLAPLGAPGCRQYISHFLLLPMRYSIPPAGAHWATPGAIHFDLQIPSWPALLGTTLFAQFAENERSLPRNKWSNPAGLTTSNALALQISKAAPNLGMSVVTSEAWDSTSPVPTTGRVDVSSGPVIRLLYR